MFSALAFRVFTLYGLKADGLIEGQNLADVLVRAFKGVGKLKYLFFFLLREHKNLILWTGLASAKTHVLSVTL